METTHTKEPWVYENRQSNVTNLCIYGENDFDVALMYGTSEEQNANAQRIVTCVNALQGVADPSKAIAEAKDLLKLIYKTQADDVTILKQQSPDPQHDDVLTQAEYYLTKMKQVLASLGEEVE